MIDLDDLKNKAQDVSKWCFLPDPKLARENTTKAVGEFTAAATPGAVLELIERLEQAEAARDALKADLAQKSWRVIGPTFENMPLVGQKVMICTDGKVIDVPAKAGMLEPSIMIWERYVGIVELCTPIEPGDAWMPWPTYKP